MKFTVGCRTCVEDALKSGEMKASLGTTLVSPGSPTLWTCPKGHPQLFWMRNPFFELLFYRGIEDFGEDDLRSAVQNFHAAYETFLSISNRVLLSSLGIEGDAPAHQADKTFSALYAARLKRFPELLPKTATDIRNRVTHREYMPSHEETELVGEAVRGFISSTIAALAPLHAEYATCATHWQSRIPAPPSGSPPMMITYLLIDFATPVGEQAKATARFGNRLLQPHPNPR